MKLPLRYAALLFVTWSLPIGAATVVGTPSVIDGDTLEVAGSRVRLFGIDAPEAVQKCVRNGQEWACGQASADHLSALIGGAAIQCIGSEVDTYGRLLAVCYVVGVDLNKTMVAQGWATAFRRYSDDYVSDETRARAAKLGVWSSSFMAPEDYRRAQSEAPAPARPHSPQTLLSAPEPQRSGSTCTIKGNRNRRGEWIYHLPSMPFYAQTRAEEMFCTEAQARAAGYRRAIVR